MSFSPHGRLAKDGAWSTVNEIRPQGPSLELPLFRSTQRFACRCAESLLQEVLECLKPGL